jgi:hypothetical protein
VQDIAGHLLSSMADALASPVVNWLNQLEDHERCKWLYASTPSKKGVPWIWPPVRPPPNYLGRMYEAIDGTDGPVLSESRLRRLKARVDCARTRSVG